MSFQSFRSNPPGVFCKKDILKNSVKFTGKHLCQSLFFNEAIFFNNFIKKETMAQMFSCEFYGIFKNIFFIEHLQWLFLKLQYIPIYLQICLLLQNKSLSWLSWLILNWVLRTNYFVT